MKKIFLTLVIVLLLMCLVSCVNKENLNSNSPITESATFQIDSATTKIELTQNNKTSTTEVHSSIETTNKSSINPRYMILYKDMISDYKKLIDFRLSKQFNDEWNKNIEKVNFSNTFQKATHELGDLGYRWSNMIVELISSNNIKSPNDFGYILYDINKDDIPELFWVRNDYSIVAIFTYQNDSVILLDSFWSRYRCFISQDGKIYCYGSNGAADSQCSVYSLTLNAGLEKVHSFSSESNQETKTVKFFEFSNNAIKEISQEEYNQLLIVYPQEQSDFWMTFNINSLN